MLQVKHLIGKMEDMHCRFTKRKTNKGKKNALIMLLTKAAEEVDDLKRQLQP